MTKLRSLYIGMNSFVASVEEQADPRLRGRLLVTTAIESEVVAGVAASYETRAYGA